MKNKGKRLNKNSDTIQIIRKKEHQQETKTINSIFSSITINQKIDFKFNREEKLSFDEIYPDYNEVLSNNYYCGKYMKNNYVNLRSKIIDLKKYFAKPLEQKDYPKYNITNKEDISENFDFVKRQKNDIYIYFKKLLPDAYLPEKNMNYKKIKKKYRTEHDINEKYKDFFIKNSVNFFEESDIIGNEKIINNDDNNKLKNKNKKLSLEEEVKNKNYKNVDIYKKKSIISSYINDEKNSKSSFITSSKKNTSIKESGSSLLSSIDKDINKNVKYTFCNFYWNYLNQRELCLYSLYNKENNISLFVRISTFILLIFLFFMINALLLTPNQIHNRYIYFKYNGKKNGFKYIFQNEIGICFLCTFIYLIIKMLFIKLIYDKLFNISHKDKFNVSEIKIIKNSEDEENEEEEKTKNKKKVKIKKYKIKTFIYFGILFIILLIAGFISINYCGIFDNSAVSLIIRFFIAFIFSIIFCAIFCLIITIIYHIGRKKKNKYLIKTYKVLSIIY